MDALVAFAAALLTFRLAGLLTARYRSSKRAELLAWSAGLAAYAVAAAAIAWGEAAGWDERAFRVYYAAGALLTAPLLGAGSLLFGGRRRAAPVALVYVGLAIGILLAVPVHGTFAAHGIPAAAARKRLDHRGDRRSGHGERPCRPRSRRKRYRNRRGRRSALRRIRPTCAHSGGYLAQNG